MRKENGREECGDTRRKEALEFIDSCE